MTWGTRNTSTATNATPPTIEATAPEFGQHTEQVLVDELGYSWERIAGLREEEVI